MPAVPEPRPPLTDGVVRVRVWTDADAPAVARACQDADIARWTLVPSPYTDAHARAFIATAPGRFRRGSAAPLAVADAEDDRLIGAVGLNAVDWERAAADLGYWVAPDERGRGVATRAVVLVGAWAFQALGLERLELRPHRDNAASQRVAVRAGYVEVPEARTRRTAGNVPGMLVYARARPAV